jgi:chromosome segregation ATPase
VNVQLRQQFINTYQGQIQSFQSQINAQDVLQQQINFVLVGLDPEAVSQIDFAALEEMALADLEKRVQDLQKVYNRDCTFVGDQEEELALISQDIEAKRQQIASASEYDRLTLDNELSDLQSQYGLINESVSPQRSRLRQDKGILKAYQSVLQRRKGGSAASQEQSDIDVTPLLQQIEAYKLQLTESLLGLQAQIHQEELELEQLQRGLGDQAQQVQEYQQEVRQLETELRNQTAVVSERWSQVRTYQELLHPAQETLRTLEERLYGVTQQMNWIQDVSTSQLTCVTELQNAVRSLG